MLFFVALPYGFEVTQTVVFSVVGTQPDSLSVRLVVPCSMGTTFTSRLRGPWSINGTLSSSLETSSPALLALEGRGPRPRFRLGAKHNGFTRFILQLEGRCARPRHLDRRRHLFVRSNAVHQHRRDVHIHGNFLGLSRHIRLNKAPAPSPQP